MITVKNISTRPFMFPGSEDVLKRMLAPGEAKEFEVTDAIVSMVSAYQDAGELVVVAGELVTGGATIESLREEAEELGIKVDARWKALRLQQEIDAKK